MRLYHLPGFYPLNAYVWDYFGWRGRLRMLYYHARFLPWKPWKRWKP